ncbi:hypothetical protein [Lentzea sp. NBRC 102530]|uniref:hypothetical protein n=1 Tax=Lentzea sp. NBRC 102530 TaxID=3032201 RepID=UPI0024A02F32|nr:hypothetical protein [Lentzea sp. NBRC 102530]GLY55184.1 hypothetical protein Lesp01_88390 [Lentzea sp. NBRC 102530]
MAERADLVKLVVAVLRDLEERFPDGANARGGGDLAVHSIELVQWIDGIPLRVPAPGCHIGLGGWDPTRFSPTYDPVTCAHCLRNGASRAAPVAVDLDQLTFDFEN